MILPGDRKSVEPMAARVEPGRFGAAHQSLHHFVAKATWDDAAVLAGVRNLVLPALLKRGPVRAWIIDDTGMPKKGRHSVGVTRQYCGQIGKQDNCQVAVSLSLATDHVSLPVAFRLYLPETWAGDAERRARTSVPDGVLFQTKPAIALDQIRTAMAAGLPPGVVLMDAGYGNDTALRECMTALGLAYVAGVQSSLTVWPPGVEPLPPKPWSGKGRPPKLLRRAPGHEPISVKALAGGLALRDVAGRHERAIGLPFRRRSRSCRAPRRGTGGASSGGVAADRMARGRREADQILVVDPAGDNAARRLGRDRQIAVAHRARLPRTQAGTRSRPLQGPRMARIPPSRDAVHRRLRFPNQGTGGDSPLRTTSLRAPPSA
ncbi:Transposase [Azospirillum palustre]